MISCRGRSDGAVWRRVLCVGLLVLTALSARCEAGKIKFEDKFRLGHRLMNVAECLRNHLESVFGADTTNKCLTSLDMALQFVAEGAAGGLNVIAAYMAEILRAIGVGGPVYVPRFTPKGMVFVAKWMILTVITYWLLYIILRLSLAMLRRGFWILKLIVVTWLFLTIISDPKASSELIMGRLFLLVLVSALWKVIGELKCKTDLSDTGSRLTNLENKLEMMKKRKKE